MKPLGKTGSCEKGQALIFFSPNFKPRQFGATFYHFTVTGAQFECTEVSAKMKPKNLTGANKALTKQKITKEYQP